MDDSEAMHTTTANNEHQQVTIGRMVMLEPNPWPMICAALSRRRRRPVRQLRHGRGFREHQSRYFVVGRTECFQECQFAGTFRDRSAIRFATATAAAIRVSAVIRIMTPRLVEHVTLQRGDLPHLFATAPAALLQSGRRSNWGMQCNTMFPIHLG